MGKCIAHLKKIHTQDTSGDIWLEQTVDEHCRETARYCQMAIENRGLEETGYLAGLIHDMGKSRLEFDCYIRKSAGEGTVRRGSVNHTAAAVKFLMGNYHQGRTEYENLTSELLAIAAGCHHGYFDCMDEQSRNGFLYRKNKTDIDYEEVINNFTNQCAGNEELNERFWEAEEEIKNCIHKFEQMVGEDNEHILEEFMFYISLLSRLVLSAVIDGDRSDTVSFMKDLKIPDQKSKDEKKLLWKKCLSKVETKLDKFPDQSVINQMRREISKHCRVMAEHTAGIYRLNAPTGSGKTLSALRFALAHAAKWGKERIIFTAPLLSILEQNAMIIREYIDAPSLILEHHSNVIHTDMTKEMLEERELLEDTWFAPIIITTLVQLLNTMFSGKNSCIRRFHSLCDSIIVIDEVQTVPVKLLSMFSLTLNFLTEFCGVTIVLCSATQPPIENIRYPLRTPVTDIFPDAAFIRKVREAFLRTRIIHEKERTIEEIGDFAVEKLNEGISNILIICNKKIQANILYKTLAEQGIDVFVLSAAMCMKHREETLERIRAVLKSSKKMICVSTQVIEAGVDISFQCVIRLTAGMDSVVQAAGRCNRNGEAGDKILAPVYLIGCIGEDLRKLQLIQMGKTATIALLNDYKFNPEKYNHELHSEAAIKFYYMKYYQQMDHGYQDGFIDGKGLYLLDLLSVNHKYAYGSFQETEQFVYRQAFKTAGELFTVFDEETTTVITQYGKGKELISRLCSERMEFNETKQILDDAKPYTVSLYKNQIDILKKKNALYVHSCGAISLIGHYNEQTGFSLEDDSLEFMEV